VEAAVTDLQLYVAATTPAPLPSPPPPAATDSSGRPPVPPVTDDGGDAPRPGRLVAATRVDATRAVRRRETCRPAPEAVTCCVARDGQVQEQRLAAHLAVGGLPDLPVGYERPLATYATVRLGWHGPCLGDLDACCATGDRYMP
jgi:hypothetical protein